MSHKGKKESNWDCLSVFYGSNAHVQTGLHNMTSRVLYNTIYRIVFAGMRVVVIDSNEAPNIVILPYYKFLV